MQINDLESLIARTGDLPAMPSIAVKVMEMVGDPSTSANDLQQIIQRDQALTTKVLKIANSAMFGVSRDISTLSHAIMILGFSTIRSIVLATSTKSIYMKVPSVGSFTAKLLWDHSLGVALFARHISKNVQASQSEETFIAGLLHDIGKSVININFSEKYEEVVSRVYNDDMEFQDVEFAVLGFAHNQVGALVLRKWNLSRNLEDAVLNHHSPRESTSNKKLTACVSLANLFAKKAGIGPVRRENVELAESDAAQVLGFSAEQIEELEGTLKETYESNKEIFEL